ncbi:MAG: hypothetical protein BGO70_00815 [Bacteroidetes bacterium 43-93]|nr:hypothetical protein [Bacteroidota bacterium]OJW96256.1 MAG: hypothetical protein BGO70_00815 [Bacteroidetes bacterium 43-93]
MRPNNLLFCTLLLGTIILSSCDPYRKRHHVDPKPNPPAEVDGWAPVYNKDSSAAIIKSSDPRTIDKGGKIYIKGDTLYQVEVGKGIHVIDVKQPANPQKLAFINVLGAQEMAIKDNVMYTNNLNDLVVLDISNVKDIKLLDRISSVFHMVDQNFPPGTGYYECVDRSKGTVVGWEQKTLNYPQCSR